MKYEGATIKLAIASPLIWEECLNSFHADYPNISVEVSTMSPEAVLAHEEWNHGFFIGITREIDETFFQYTTLLDRELPVVLIPKDNPLSKYQSIDFRDLNSENFISLGELNPTAHKFIYDMCQLSGFKPRKVIKANYFSRMKYLEGNKGIVLTTDLGVAKNSLSSEAFSIVPISYPHLTRQQAIAWERDADISPVENIFLKYIIDYCRKHPHL